MIVFRLCRNTHPDFLSGIGAERSGGRWNSKGVKMVYTSESRSLCTAELAVHLPLGILPTEYLLVTIEIPRKIKVDVLPEKGLSPDWKLFPHPDSTQRTGNAFVKESRYAVLKVPSAVVPGDFNFLLNPFHPDFHWVKVVKTEKFSFDERLFRR